ncbi:Outer membrane receptor proteins, mostly Fe transport [Variovorax sp. HW608]|uniref:TonB-dependent receptor n=1 Tax=Variovorax sp. HW608 TaxID=1034889 RepID=UPI00081F7D7F|nr:TonB-dependent receptor [Variovorax sp. HW608]SCK56704.1 Outer membrane receptor proteins, mostly Fe transport [Variovorax sp. HW608]
MQCRFGVPRMPRLPAFALLATASVALLRAGPATAQEQQQEERELPTVTVVAPTPLPGLDVPKDQVPANVQSATGEDIDRAHALDLAGFLSRRMNGVTVNEIQGNPFQVDINYRGFTASPLLGTPQGLSVYLDGVRLNQPFGDVVSWDLIPHSVIQSVVLMPGSNPLFGLNTLGGALSVRTKDGFTSPGTSVQLLGGSYGRVAAEFETGGSRDDGLNWYLAGNRFHEDGWRTASPSDLRQLFAKVGKRSRDTEVSLTTAYADNDLTGNGLLEQHALQRDWKSIYTLPDQTQNRSIFVNLAASHDLSDTLRFTGNAYWREIKASTLNGDVNADSLGQALYQPDAAERAALAGAGFTGFPTSGETQANTPFPRWRCIANVLTNDAPNETCNGLYNRTRIEQHNQGLAGQFSALMETAGIGHQLVLGAAYDASRVGFDQSAQFGFINPDRSITPLFGPGAFADGTQNTENPLDARVGLSSRSRTWSVYASDLIEISAATHLTLSGRYNHSSVDNVDWVTPGPAPGSLTGDHSFSRFNPAIGLTFAASEALTLYAGVNQGSRAPTAIELGCADPATPCKLPNSFAGDPPLKQVVTTTFEAGLRGNWQRAVSWNFGLFRSDNQDDLLFVSDNASGFGYFKNFGRTRRQGIEAGLAAQPARDWTVGANLSLLDATFRSAEVINGSGNSSNSSALAGAPGTDGTIAIRPGDPIPLLPRRTLKLAASWEPHAQWRFDLDMVASSGANVRGNENGLHMPDGIYYTGDGRTGGYAVFNLGADYRPRPGMKVFVQINNLFDRKYVTGGQLGANAFGPGGAFVARPFPANANGDFPLVRATFLAPGAPRTAWLGVRYTFGG